MFPEKLFDTSYLNWRDRPESLKQKIASVWEKVCHATHQWRYNGGTRYNMACVAEKQLLKKIIIQNYPQRKEFYFLDIGAGNFRLGNSMVEYLNNDCDLPPDIKIHVIGVSGQQNQEPHLPEITERGLCIQYNFGSFQIENLIDAFEQRGFNFDQKIDVIVSRWTFRHLVDPLGTLLQTYHLLRSDGFLLMDGFNFYVQTNDQPVVQNGDDMVAQMQWLLYQIKAPFLVYPTMIDYVLHQFVIKKSHEPLLIKLNYLNTGFKDHSDHHSGSGVVTTFQSTAPQKNNLWKNHLQSHRKYLEDYRLYGDSGLFDELSSVIEFERGWGQFGGSLFEESAPFISAECDLDGIALVA